MSSQIQHPVEQQKARDISPCIHVAPSVVVEASNAQGLGNNPQTPSKLYNIIPDTDIEIVGLRDNGNQEFQKKQPLMEQLFGKMNSLSKNQISNIENENLNSFEKETEAPKILSNSINDTIHKVKSSSGYAYVKKDSTDKNACLEDKDTCGSSHNAIIDGQAVPRKAKVRQTVPLDKRLVEPRVVTMFQDDTWRERYLQLVREEDIPVDKFEKNVLAILLDDHYQCPLCRVPVQPEYILRHFASHTAERAATSNPFHALPMKKGKEALKYKNCFVKGCEGMLFDPDINHNFRKQMRWHLSEYHNEKELFPYGLHNELLRQDMLQLMDKPIKQCSEMLSFVHPKLERILMDNIEPDHLMVYQSLHRKVFDLESDKSLSGSECSQGDITVNEAEEQMCCDTKIQIQLFTEDEENDKDNKEVMVCEDCDGTKDCPCEHCKKDFDEQIHAITIDMDSKFDINKAFALSKQNSGNATIYKASLLAKFHDRFVRQDMLSDIPETIEKYGKFYDLRFDWEVVDCDTGKYDNSWLEDNILRTIHFSQLHGGKKVYPALYQLRSHGWRSQEELNYILITENSAGSLIEQVSMKCRHQIHGFARLIAARCMVSILETLNNLYINDNMVITNIEPHSIKVRHDYKSCYIHFAVLQNEGIESWTVGWPFYPSNTNDKVLIKDCYTAAVCSFLNVIAPTAWNKVWDEQQNVDFDDRLRPMDFIGRVLNRSEWFREDRRVRKLIEDEYYALGDESLMFEDRRVNIIKLFKRWGSVQHPDNIHLRMRGQYPDPDGLEEWYKENVGEDGESSDEDAKQEQEEEAKPSERASRVKSRCIAAASTTIKKEKKAIKRDTKKGSRI